MIGEVETNQKFYILDCVMILGSGVKYLFIYHYSGTSPNRIWSVHRILAGSGRVGFGEVNRISIIMITIYMCLVFVITEQYFCSCECHMPVIM